MIKRRILPTALALVFSAGVSTFAVAEDVPVIELGADSANRSSMNNQSGQAPRGGELAMIIQQLQDEVRTLRGQLEQQNYQLKQMERQQLDRYRDLDRRISSLSSGAPAQPISSSPVQSQQSAPIPSGQPQVSSTPKAAPAQADAKPDDAQVYRDAFTLVRERKFQQAENAFSGFISQYPQSPRLPNAHYWLGEVRLAQQKPELARESFIQVVTAYADHRKAPDAAYKLGIVYDQLGDKKKSEEYLDLVIQKYPQSSAVRLAKEFKRLQ